MAEVRKHTLSGKARASPVRVSSCSESSCTTTFAGLVGSATDPLQISPSIGFDEAQSRSILHTLSRRVCSVSLVGPRGVSVEPGTVVPGGAHRGHDHNLLEVGGLRCLA